LRIPIFFARAQDITGFRIIIIQSPCPVGWRYMPNNTIKIARLGVQSGVWPLFEILDGINFKLNYKPKELVPVSEYIRTQNRFRHMTENEVAEMQKYTVG